MRYLCDKQFSRNKGASIIDRSKGIHTKEHSSRADPGNRSSGRKQWRLFFFSSF